MGKQSAKCVKVQNEYMEYIHFISACSVMVIILENGDNDQSSTPRQGCLHFT